jgi:bifunctional non-homologous end joining protein LigD
LTVRSSASRNGEESFEALQGVMRRRLGGEDVAFLAFDLLWLHGRSLQRMPYAERREELEALQFEPPVALSPRFDDGEALFEQTLRQGYEGVVAKRRRSMYQPGVRSRDWIKTKHWVVEEFLIGGWSPAAHEHGWGLLVGEVEPRGAFSVSPAGWSSGSWRTSAPPSRSGWSRWYAEARVYEPDAVFVEPRVLADIRYLDRTSGGLLRHAAFRQLGGRWSPLVLFELTKPTVCVKATR